MAYSDVSLEADEDGRVHRGHDGDVSDWEQELHRVRVRLVLVVAGDVRKAVAQCAADHHHLQMSIKIFGANLSWQNSAKHTIL